LIKREETGVKKSVKWKVLTAVLAVIMLLSACTNGGGNNKPSTGGETSAPSGTASSAPTEQAEEPINLLWLSFDPPEGDETPVQKFLEERFNVKIENMRVDRTSWTEHLNIRLARGNSGLLQSGSAGRAADRSHQGEDA
jgi:putative aldouronate transport system substrate-binding protein